MKKILFAFAAGLIPALAVTNETYAQNPSDLNSAKPVIHFSLMNNTSDVEKPNMVALNLKALKSFRKQYKVTNEKWSLGADCIIASYELDSVNHFVYFDKKGHWKGSLKTYSEDKMPKDIRTMIKREYFDYKILVVNEIEPVNAVAQPTYVVTIKGENDTKLIRIQDSNMNVYQEFTKN
jgi:hypothetical protein